MKVYCYFCYFMFFGLEKENIFVWLIVIYLVLEVVFICFNNEIKFEVIGLFCLYFVKSMIIYLFKVYLFFVWDKKFN